MNKLIRFLGSLAFAIFLIASLTLILITSTFLESAYGTPFVQRFFYQTWWFDAFLALVAVNVFCATLPRWPFKKHHTGFLVTHVGIILVLVGSLMSRVWGVDGQMALGESQTRSEIQLQGYQLVAHTPDHRTVMVNLKSLPAKEAKKIDLGDPALSLFIHQVAEGVEESSEIKTGGTNDPVNHAARFTLSSEMTGAQESQWLVEKNPFDPNSRRFVMGAAAIELKEKEAPVIDETPAPAEPAVKIIEKKTGRVFWVDLAKIEQKAIPLGDTQLTLYDLRYFPDARVGEDNKLMSVSDEALNPAVEFTVTNAQGDQRGYTRFKHFPDFDALHGRDGSDIFGLTVDLHLPADKETPRVKRPGLTFYFSENGWSYESTSSKGSTSGPLQTGQAYPTGWMDFSFRVDELLDHAVVKRVVTKHEGAPKERLGVELSLESSGKTVGRDWALMGAPARFDSPQGPVMVALGIQSAPVPFSLTLKDFRKVDYPGTGNPASFESDVILEDAAEHLKIEKTISMNKPLDHKGYRVFQSSYSQDPMAGETSIFTVAKNPGIGLIYGGSVILFIGIALVFYVKPLSSLGQRGNRK